LSTALAAATKMNNIMFIAEIRYKQQSLIETTKEALENIRSNLLMSTERHAVA
jgi:hypothetical protein